MKEEISDPLIRIRMSTIRRLLPILRSVSRAIDLNVFPKAYEAEVEKVCDGILEGMREVQTEVEVRMEITSSMLEDAVKLREEILRDESNAGSTVDS